jgi:hypothetical protein
LIEEWLKKVHFVPRKVTLLIGSNKTVISNRISHRIFHRISNTISWIGLDVGIGIPLISANI